MSQFTSVYLPQSSPNDLTALLLEWNREAGRWVNRGEVIAMAETTKSVFDIEAPQAGYLYPLLEGGQEVAVGTVIAAISSEPSTVAASQAWLAATAKSPALSEPTPGRPQIATRKAELLAQRQGVDLTAVPATGERISEADVLAYLAQRKALPTPRPEAVDLADLVDQRYPVNRIQRLLILGGGNGAIQILDLLAQGRRQRAVAVMDDNSALHGRQLAGVPVVGGIDSRRAAAMLASGEIDAAVISISTSIAVRERLFDSWQAQDIPFANVLHPSAVIGMNVTMGTGNVVMAFCHFGACATVGDNNFLSAYCSIEHHCVLGSHCSFGPGVVTSSRVQIEDRVRFGTGIFVEPGVHIGAESVIASGLAITQPIPAQSTVKARVTYTLRKRG
jgi:sugar O-acyltransferase (sialic acid O-acetyltransferase NeuD family)